MYNSPSRRTCQSLTGKRRGWLLYFFLCHLGSESRLKGKMATVCPYYEKYFL
jgi:hypothetical protein